MAGRGATKFENQIQLANNLDDLRMRKKFCDVTLVCMKFKSPEERKSPVEIEFPVEGESHVEKEFLVDVEFLVHRVVMAACSSVFRAMFESRFKESIEKRVHLYSSVC